MSDDEKLREQVHRIQECAHKLQTEGASPDCVIVWKGSPLGRMTNAKVTIACGDLEVIPDLRCPQNYEVVGLKSDFAPKTTSHEERARKFLAVGDRDALRSAQDLAAAFAEVEMIGFKRGYEEGPEPTYDPGTSGLPVPTIVLPADSPWLPKPCACHSAVPCPSVFFSRGLGTGQDIQQALTKAVAELHAISQPTDGQRAVDAYERRGMILAATPGSCRVCGLASCMHARE
jgi:hypothetical protein